MSSDKVIPMRVLIHKQKVMNAQEINKKKKIINGYNNGNMTDNITHKEGVSRLTFSTVMKDQDRIFGDSSVANLKM